LCCWPDGAGGVDQDDGTRVTGNDKRLVDTNNVGIAVCIRDVRMIAVHIGTGHVAADVLLPPRRAGFYRPPLRGEVPAVLEQQQRGGSGFTITTSTIGRRHGAFPRWLTWLGYLVAVILLFVVTSAAWFELAFPLWVLLVSCYTLVTGRTNTESR
jgi:hypothetical protein